jgi:[ribosomal protein S5]-alanine N-acetyltransferase
MIAKKLKGERILMRNVEQSDCNTTYLNWLEDLEINQYLETRWESQNLKKIKYFVASMKESENSVLFAIIEVSTNKHIGNIKIGPINYNHKYADISYFIGDSCAWGKGYASEALSMATDYAINILNLDMLVAGVYGNNLGSQRVLEKVGYELTGVFKNQLLNVKGDKEDHLWYAFGVS